VNFTELERSLPRSQELTICPCPEPQDSNPRSPNLFLSDPCVINFNYSSIPQLLPSGSPPNLYAFRFSSIRSTHPAHLYPAWWDHPILYDDWYVTWSFSLCNFLKSPVTSCLLDLLSKIPQPTFLLQCDIPSFTPIRNNRQDYSSIYFNIYISGQQTGRQYSGLTSDRHNLALICP
jgi:hypothetical protein